MGLGYEVYSQRAQHFHHGAKFWFGIAAQRSIKVLAGKSGFFGNSGHAYRARHRSDCHRDFGCVVGLKSFCEIGCYHFWAIEVLSRIKWSSFCHCSVLQLISQFPGRCDVRILRTFVSAAKKNYDLFATLNEVNPVSRTVMYPHLANATANGSDIAGVAEG